MNNNINILRIVAFLIDISFALSVSVPFVLLILFFKINSPLYLSFVLALVYSMLFCKDLLGCRSLGKRMCNLLIVGRSKDKLSNLKLILRNIFIIIWPIELVMLFINSGRRVGDILFSTTVVHNSQNNKDSQSNNTIIPFVIVFLSLFICFYFIVMVLQGSSDPIKLLFT